MGRHGRRVLVLGSTDTLLAFRPVLCGSLDGSTELPPIEKAGIPPGAPFAALLYSASHRHALRERLEHTQCINVNGTKKRAHGLLCKTLSPNYLMVGGTGIEPVTPCMSSKYSNHLS